MSNNPVQPLLDRLAHMLTGAERRQAARHACRRILPVPVLARPAFQKCTAFLKDISATGFGLITQGRLDRGSALFVQLHGHRPGTTHTHLARVVYSHRHGASHWFVGCRLACPLSDDEIERVLEAAV